jgi:hypothetical protein
MPHSFAELWTLLTRRWCVNADADEGWTMSTTAPRVAPSSPGPLGTHKRSYVSLRQTVARPAMLISSPYAPPKSGVALHNEQGN